MLPLKCVCYRCFLQTLFDVGNAFMVLVLTIFNEGQTSIRPSIHFSSIVESCSNPFLEPTSSEATRVKFLAHGNNVGLWWCSNPRPPHYEPDVQPTAPHRPLIIRMMLALLLLMMRTLTTMMITMLVPVFTWHWFKIVKIDSCYKLNVDLLIICFSIYVTNICTHRKHKQTWTY